MLEFIGRADRSCDGISRRSFLQVGALAIGGLTLPHLLRLRAEQPSLSNRKSVILIWLAGGPSHIDMYDLKPDAPGRGPRRIQADRHERARHPHRRAPAASRPRSWTSWPSSVPRSTPTPATAWGRSGCRPATRPTIEVNDNIYPVDRLRRGQDEGAERSAACRPTSTCRRQVAFGKAAYLGASYNPFSPDSNPNDAGFQVRNLKLPGRVDAARLERRKELLKDLDTHSPRHRHQGRLAGSRHLLPRRDWRW